MGRGEVVLRRVLYSTTAFAAAITWGARTGRPKRRNSIKMGSYSVEDRLIRIHRSLDRVFVPRFFVAWIVFHEMLHQVHDIRVKHGFVPVVLKENMSWDEMSRIEVNTLELAGVSVPLLPLCEY